VKRLLSLVALLAACSPDIPQNAAPGNVIVAEFDPAAVVPQVPTPNDLALTTGKIVVPAAPGDSPAQTEFNTSYLGTLSGFPFESTATVSLSGALDPATVTASSVIAIDVTVSKTDPQSASVTVKPAYDATRNVINVPPPGGAWTRAHQYAIALLAGPGGLKGAKDEPVIGSETWELVSSPSPLVDCPGGNLESPDCTLAVDIIPSTVTDPTARLADQLQKALQLEPIRLGYAPLLAEIEKQHDLARAQIPILWTFTIVDAGEVTFDPANDVIPFPNDVVRSTSTGLVNLPNPTTGAPLTAADCAAATDMTLVLYCGLNTLDGFSTLAAPISQNSSTDDAVEQGRIDATTLVAGKTVGLAPLASKAPTAEQTTPEFTPCLNCLSSPKADGTPQTSPQELQWDLGAPLDEQTTYGAWVTGDVKDSKGKNVIANPVFALVRSSTTLVVSGHSAVDILTDAQAAQLEPLRVALKPLIDGLVAKGVSRSDLALAWGFTTQAEATQLDQLYAYPAQVPMLPDSPLYVYDATSQYQAIASNAGITNIASNVASMIVGEILSPVAVTGPGGTLDVTAPKPEPVTFTLVIPRSAAPATGYPVTIFGHGFTRSREDFIAIAGALAGAGIATIATDVLNHGDRTSCTGSAAVDTATTPSDDDACAEPTTQRCNEDPLVGRCVARDPTTRLACNPGTADDYNVCAVAGQGACLPTVPNGTAGVCEGGDFLRDNYAALEGLGAQGAPFIPFQRTVISGWNEFSLTNFFSTRDNFRQQVIDLSQLVRVLKSTATTNLTAQASALEKTTIALDTTKLGYVGQSLGGILGTLFDAVSPDVTNVVLNVPGGALPQIILNAPSFAPYKAALVATLAKQGIAVGTPAFDQFIGIAQWVLDPADPANMGYRLTHGVATGGGVTAPNANRKAFIQFIQGDQTVPNIANFALVTAADRTFTPTPPSFNCMAPLFCYEFTEAIDMFDATSVPPSGRHGFLLAPPAATGMSPSATAVALTVKAQTQAVTFLASGQL
jgi:hypothetical protein